MPGSHTVHLLLTQLHNAVYYYYYFLNFTIIIFLGNADDDDDGDDDDDTRCLNCASIVIHEHENGLG